MRVGQNPIKAIEKISPPAPLTTVIINYIPFLSGYYSQSLQVLKLSLASLLANTETDFDLLVFDNGSCSEVRDYLLNEQQKGNIQFLLLSERNMGKPAAWNFALTAAPGEFVAYADSDVYFYPGWVSPTLQAFKDFPNAGMVTAMPILTPHKYSTSTITAARKQRGVEVESGNLIPWDDFWRHARSLGDDEDKARSFYKKNQAIKVGFRGRDYFAGAAHFQFTAPKYVLNKILPIPAERPMGQVRLLDEVINRAGYLRLCTATWHVQHLGNTVPQSSDLIGNPPIRVKKAGVRAYSQFWQWRPLRKFLQWLNGWSFDRLHRTK